MIFHGCPPAPLGGDADTIAVGIAAAFHGGAPAEFTTQTLDLLDSMTVCAR